MGARGQVTLGTMRCRRTVPKEGRGAEADPVGAVRQEEHRFWAQTSPAVPPHSRPRLNSGTVQCVSRARSLKTHKRGVR